jgi:hypothetical protein
MTNRMLVAALAAVLVFTAVSVRASDPCGVYALIEKVVLEPNDTEPTEVQIWGAFALSDARMGGGYLPAQRGYLYYSCPKGRDTVCLNEWLDLKSMAGKPQMVGFGGRYVPTGKLRKLDEKPTMPDTYPIQMGVLKVGPAAVGSDLQKALSTK